jgi:signal transduction histidine kinase
MGLGLAIVHNAVEMHRGAGIMARNVEPHGFEIKFQFPIIPGPTAPSDADARRAYQTASRRE